MTRALLDDVAVIRTKNAGPFTLTYDVLFTDLEAFHFWRATAAFEPGNVAGLIGRDPSDVRVIWHESALAVKIVTPRTVPAGAWGDTDIFGCQQHAPLLDVSHPDQ